MTHMVIPYVYMFPPIVPHLTMCFKMYRYNLQLMVEYHQREIIIKMERERERVLSIYVFSLYFVI